MRVGKVILGKYYRKKDKPRVGWAKVLSIIKPHSGINTHSYPIARCEWTVDKEDTFGMIKYFKVTDLIEGGEL